MEDILYIMSCTRYVRRQLAQKAYQYTFKYQ